MGWRAFSNNNHFSSLLRAAKPHWQPLSQRLRLFLFLSLIPVWRFLSFWNIGLDNFSCQQLKCVFSAALSGQKYFIIQVQLYYKIVVIVVPLWWSFKVTFKLEFFLTWLEPVMVVSLLKLPICYIHYWNCENRISGLI